MPPPPPPPVSVRVTLWVCCNCGWTANASTAVQCINCQHGFSSAHCSKETHDVADH